MGRQRRAAGAGLVTLALGLGLLAGCSDDSGEGESATGVASVESPAVLDPWFDAVRRDDRDPARLVVLGDSVSEGYGLAGHLERRWVDRLQAGLRTRSGTPGCPTTPGGWQGTTSLVPADYRAPTLPDPVVIGATVPAPTLGPGGRGRTLKPGGAVTWTVTADSVDVGYRTRFAGGPLSIEIDGQVPADGVVSTDTDPQAERQVWSSGDLGPGVHTVTVRNALPRSSSSWATVTDLTPFRGDRDRCVHVLDASRSGVSARTIAQTPSYLKDSLSLDPDLLLVPLGFNDLRAGIPAPEFGRSLDSLIQQARGMGYEGPILLVGWFTPEPGAGGPTWSGYLQQMHAMTGHDGVSFVDLSVVLPPADPGSRYFIDGLHPSAAGQPLIADSFLEILAPPAEDVTRPATSSPDAS
ncbi:SGNH/GDSL hydrolase family protein [Janibacter limosus]|uniref:SGNH/GDSL hydrolase family protein n=1 Tax=Janibacter limosus TaxID=53458 RepID=UPI0014706591|nr:SGNH/GDSL hydrolase family protein [Janibacter limosus]